MKIVQINSVCGVGSTGRIVVDLATAEQNKGNDVIVVYGRGKANVEHIKTYKIGGLLNVVFHGIESRLLDRHGFGSRIATKKLIKRLKEYKPDLIHLHNIHGYYINIKLLFDYIKKNNIVVEWTLHDCWSFTGHCSFAGEEIGCNRWKSGCGKCLMKHYYPTSIIIDNSRRNYYCKKEIFTGVKNLTLITPSQWLADMTRQTFLSEYPVVVEKNRIDLSSFKPTYSSFRNEYKIEDKFVLLCVGFAWDEWKINDLKKLAHLLRSDEVLIIVGMDEKPINEFGENVIGIRRTDSKTKLAEIYTVADVFVNPTYSDNYPTVNLEAEACGTPVVTYDTGGCKETITRDDSICIRKGDIEALLEAARVIKKGCR